MASRMIHYTIAQLIADKIDLSDRNKFLVGSLAPDMASYEAGSHEKGIHKRVHFMEEFEDLGVRGSNWLTFFHKYLEENFHDEFALGYFIHLICDMIWLRDIQVKYIYSAECETRMEAIMRGYEDMRKCNSRIAEKYGISYDIHPLGVFTIDEIDISYQAKLLDDLKLDFLPYGDDFDLKVHNWDAICDYIDKCVNICLKEIELVMSGKEPDSPIPYMISIDQ